MINNNPFTLFELKDNTDLRMLYVFVFIGTIIASLVGLLIPFLIIVVGTTSFFYIKKDSNIGFMLVARMLIPTLFFALLTAEIIQRIVFSS